MKYILFFLISLSALSPLQAQLDKKQKTNEHIRIVPVHRTPEPERVQLTILFPRNKKIESQNPVRIQIRLRGYPLGANSNFPRASEVSTFDYGQSLHIIVDEHPFFPVTGPSIDPYDEEGDFYQSTYIFEIPFYLNEGTHVVRAFPTRSYGESLKTDNSFAATEFHMDHRTESVDLSAPYLTYNIPTGTHHLEEGEPVLLDFYIRNCKLSEYGYRVRLSIDGKEIATLTEWRPYYIYGLKKGTHTIRLQLLDRRNRVGQAGFNDVETTIYIR